MQITKWTSIDNNKITEIHKNQRYQSKNRQKRPGHTYKFSEHWTTPSENQEMGSGAMEE